MVLKLGVSPSAYVLNPSRDDAVRLVGKWLSTIREEWPRQVNVASFAESADATVNTVVLVRSLSEGSAGPLHWVQAPAEAERRMRSSPDLPKRGKLAP